VPLNGVTWFVDVDFPEELVQVRHDDKLVVFVGSGASIPVPSNLQKFSRVMEQVVDRTNESADPKDVGERPDLVLGRLDA
jgi:hypothetical protein